MYCKFMVNSERNDSGRNLKNTKLKPKPDFSSIITTNHPNDPGCRTTIQANDNFHVNETDNSWQP